MATRSEFTDAEWTAMQTGITGAGLYVSTVDRRLFDTFKEANALAKHLAVAHARSDSELIRELAAWHGRPFSLTASPQEIERGTVAALQEAVGALKAKSPADVPAYSALVLDVAESVAAAANDVSAQENDALSRIRSALDDTR